MRFTFSFILLKEEEKKIEIKGRLAAVVLACESMRIAMLLFFTRGFFGGNWKWVVFCGRWPSQRLRNGIFDWAASEVSGYRRRFVVYSGLCRWCHLGFSSISLTEIGSVSVPFGGLQTSRRETEKFSGSFLLTKSLLWVFGSPAIVKSLRDLEILSYIRRSANSSQANLL